MPRLSKMDNSGGVMENKKRSTIGFPAEKFHKPYPSWLLTLIQDQPVGIKMISSENRYFLVHRS